MFNKKINKIQFISTIEGLDSIKECLPRPAKHFIPQWFKDIPSNGLDNIKVCPGILDYFSQGYIIPMWCDSSILKTDIGWSWKTSDNKFGWSLHENFQFLDYNKASFNGIDAQFVFKTNCPWRIITPPGWSVLQLPLFYHFNKDWSILPGIIDTDVHHEINQQVLYHGNGKNVEIKYGEPFVLYIPFKRSNKLKNIIRYKNKKDNLLFKKNELIIASEFRPNGKYRELQRKINKKIL